MKPGKPLERRTPLRSDPETTRAFVNRAQRSTAVKAKRRPISPASPEQRRKVAGLSCLIPDCTMGPVDPAHVLSRGTNGIAQDDARSVIPLCRHHHRLLDSHKLDLLPFEALMREEISFAVWRAGLLNVIERLSGERWRPVSEDMAA